MAGPAPTCTPPSVHGHAVHFRLVSCAVPLQNPHPSVRVRTPRSTNSAHGPAMRSPLDFRARSHRTLPGSIILLPLSVPFYLPRAPSARLPVRGTADEFSSPTYPAFAAPTPFPHFPPPFSPEFDGLLDPPRPTSPFSPHFPHL